MCAESIRVMRPLFHSGEGGSTPTSALTYGKIRKACKNVLTWLSLTRKEIGGHTYGSERLLIYSEGRRYLYNAICKEYMEEFCETPPFDIDYILDTYSQCRKGNYKRLRDGLPVECDTACLFEDPSFDGVSAVLYAYWGFVAPVEKRLVKIGYTSQMLGEYLKSKEIAHNPELLASRPGSKEDEKREHQKWRNLLECGREWFRPTPVLFADFRKEWSTEIGFDAMAERILLEYEQ